MAEQHNPAFDKPQRRDAIAWFEIPVLDMPRARKFYETVLSTTLNEFQVPGGGPLMAMFPMDGGVNGALVCMPSFYTPSHHGPLIYLNANPDVQLALNKVPAAGGKVLVPKTMITEEYGYMAVMEDTEGNRIALHNVAEKYFKS
jgi:predicted enzyme related to lactoylglutathione lyase